MKKLKELSPAGQLWAQILGYHIFDENEEVKEYKSMNKKEWEENRIKLRELANRIYRKYTKRKISDEIELTFKKRTAKNIKSTGSCWVRKEDDNSLKVLKIQVEEELFFYPKDLIAVLKHELAHLYEIEEFGKTKHGKNFRIVLKEKFRLPSKFIERNPACLEKSMKIRYNEQLLRRIKIETGEYMKI